MSKAPIVDDVIESHILQIYSIYQPSPTSPLGQVLQTLNREYELSKKSKYREELHFYIRLLHLMLKVLQSTAPDILGTQKTVTDLAETVRKFQATIADKNSPKTTEFFAKFRADIGATVSKFIAKTQEQIRILKLHQPAGYQLAIQKLEKLIEQASVITTTTFLLPKNNEEATALTQELYTAIQKLQTIAETHASELALPYGLNVNKTIDQFTEITAEFRKNPKNHQNFFKKILHAANEFKSQIERLFADLKGEGHEQTRKQYRELMKVVRKIVETAKNQKDPDLISKLDDQIRLLNEIAENSAALTPNYGEEKTTPEQTRKQMAILLEEKFRSLPSLSDDKEGLKTLSGTLIGLAGTIVGADAVLGSITNALDLIFNTASIADSADEKSILNYLKSNPHDVAMFAGSVTSLVTAIFVCPPAVPVILQAMGVYGATKDLISTIKELHAGTVEEGIALGDKFIKAAKEYVDMRITAEFKENFHRIPPEWSDKEMLTYAKSKEKRQEQKLASILVDHFICGQSNYPIIKEIKKLASILDTDKSRNYNGKKLHDQLVGDLKTNNVVLIPLYRKFGGTPDGLAGFLLRLVQTPTLSERISQLKQALPGQQIDPQFIKKFAENLSAGIVNNNRISPVITLTGPSPKI